MKSTKKQRSISQSVPGTPARLWLSFWPNKEPAVHTLKLTNVFLHPFGLRFATYHPPETGTSLQIRLLLPPTTAVAVQGIVSYREPLQSPARETVVSIRFTLIREVDRQRLTDFTEHRHNIRLKAHCVKATNPILTPDREISPNHSSTDSIPLYGYRDTSRD